ncbi:MAG: hypothetical protein ACFE85_00740 [Candidatus Hodarchaeota archaeon]
MKKRITIISVILLFTLIPVSNVFAFEYIDSINDGISIFFLVNLDAGEVIEVNVTHANEGNFTLFLFDRRPNKDYIKFDKSLNEEIFDIAINYSLIENPYINYNATQSKIYYIQLILLENGPDIFSLYCNKDLTRYYLPIIPGYHLKILLFSVLLPVSFIILLKYRKVIKKKSV